MQFGRDFGSPYSIAGQTGTMAAALAQDSIVFGMRAKTNPADAPPRFPVQVDGVFLAYTTIVAFTTPLTVGRRLGIFRASGASVTGQTALSAVAKWTKNAGADDGLEVAPRISTTAALTAAGVVREANPLGVLDLTTFGAAGARTEKYYPFLDLDAPVILEPGELLVVSIPVAMDAAGTWQLVVEVDYRRAG
jgi:hypothetical protein